MIETAILSFVCGLTGGLISYICAEYLNCRKRIKISPNTKVEVYKLTKDSYSVSVKSKDAKVSIYGGSEGIFSIDYAKQ